MILRVACVIGAIQLAGCAGYFAEQRLIWVQNRTDDVVWKDLVPKYEFQHNCDEVSESIAQHLVGIGFDIGTQSNTKVVTDKRYNSDYSGARVIMVVLHPAAAGCRIVSSQVDSWGGRSESTRAWKVEEAVIEMLEPERAKAMRADAKQRAEAEYAAATGGNAGAAPRAEPGGEPKKEKAAAVAAAEPEPKPRKEKASSVATAEGEPKPKKEKAEAVATAEGEPKREKAAPVAAAEGEEAAGAGEEEAPPSPTKKTQKPQRPVKKDAEASAGPPPPPTFEIAGAPIVALNRSLSFVDQKTSTINPSEPNMRPYDLGYGPAVALHLVWYPLAAVTDGAARNFGVEGGIEQGFNIQTTLDADDPTLPNARFGTTVHEYEGGVRYRIPFGAGHHAWFSVTGGEQAFVFNSSSTCALATPNTCRPNLNTPDTIYRYIRPGLGLRLDLGADFALAATVGFRYSFNGGGTQFARYFPHHTAYGLDAAFYLGYRVVPAVEIRIGGELRQYVFAMHPTMADAQAIMAGGTPIKVAEGAVDRYISGTIGVAFLYGGAPTNR